MATTTAVAGSSSPSATVTAPSPTAVTRWPRRTRSAEAAGELLRDGAHAPGREGDVAEGEHAVDELEHAAGGAQLPVEQDAAEQRPEEAVDDRVGEAVGGQGLPGGGLGAGGQLLQRPGGDPPAQLTTLSLSPRPPTGARAVRSPSQRRRNGSATVTNLPPVWTIAPG